MTYINHSLKPLTSLNSITTPQKNQEQAPYIPDEIIKKIFENFEPKDLPNCREVCKQWSQSAKRLMNESWILNLRHRKGVYTSKDYLGHKGCINSVVLSANGKKLFSGSSDKTIKIWDVETRDCLHTLKGRTAGVRSVVLSTDGKKLFSGSDDGPIKIWDVETGNCLHTLEGHIHLVKSVVLSADGKKLFSGSFDTIKIWDVETGNCLHTLEGHIYLVNSLVLSADGKNLFSGCGDKTIKIWDIETGDCLHTLRGHKASVESVVFSADDKKLFSCSIDDTIKIWDVETGNCLYTLEGHTSSVNSLVLSTDGKKLFSGSSDKTIKIWDVESRKCLYTLEGHTHLVESVVLSADDKKLFSCSRDTTIKIWDVETGDCLRTLEGHADCVRFVVLSADEKKLFSGSINGEIKIWNFGASSMEVFEEIANLLKKIEIWNFLASSMKTPEQIANSCRVNSEESIKQELERFERMPLRAKQAIYEELYSICKPFQNDYPGCAEHAFHDQYDQSSTPAQKADAILSYLRKQHAKEENPDPSKTTQVSGSVLKINHTKELESSVKVTEITDLDTISKETALDALEVHDLLADLGIVTQEDYSEKLKNTPIYLTKIGLKTVEDLKALGLGFEPIDKLIVNTEELTDRLELQTQAYNNKEALLSFVERLLKVVDQKIKEIPTAAFHITEKPWMDLQKNLKAFKANLDNIKFQDFNSLKENFSPKKCAAMAETANALAEATEEAEKKYQIEKLGAYVNQWGIHKLWTRLRQEGIENLSAFLQQSKESQDLFRMGE